MLSGFVNQKCAITNESTDAMKPYTESPIKTFFSSSFFIRNGQAAMLIIVPIAVEMPRTATRFCEPRRILAA